MVENILKILNVARKWVIRSVEMKDLLFLENGDEYQKYRSLMKLSFNDHMAGKKIYLVAEVEGKIAGQIIIDKRILKDLSKSDGKTRAYIYSFRVFMPYQNQGLGTLMLQFCESLLRKTGFIYAVIAAEVKNPRALKLYERLGYKIFKQECLPWEFIDEKGVQQKISEPEWVLEKKL
jgi:ribosomal protein S18 acetylase RimI-like enzyme